MDRPQMYSSLILRALDGLASDVRSKLEFLRSARYPPEVHRVHLEVYPDLSEQYTVVVFFLDDMGMEVFTAEGDYPIPIVDTEVLDVDVGVPQELLDELGAAHPQLDTYYYGGEVVLAWLAERWYEMPGEPCAVDVTVGVHDCECVLDLHARRRITAPLGGVRLD